MTDGLSHHRRAYSPRPHGGLDIGRRLRVLAGVDESLLDQVPLERTRYVGLGGVVLGTAVVAGMSMWFALSQVLGHTHLGLIIPAALWALMVLNMDRWLVSTITGIWQRRLLMLIPRLLVAMVLGFIIAEPLVLRVFETAVVHHVIVERQKELNTERDRLVACNPQVPTAAPARADCHEALLTASTMEAESGRLAGMEADATALQAEVDEKSRKYDELVGKRDSECLGEKGRGLSGKVGEGPLCKQRQKIVNRFLAASQLTEKRAKLAGLRDEISELRGPFAAKQATYAQTIEARIQERLDSLPDKNDPVGLLERMEALHEVTAENVYLLGATWLFRLFLILIDCLPVVVKLIGGSSAYERMVNRTNEQRERLHEKKLQLRVDEEIGELELRAHEVAEDHRRRRQVIDTEGKIADAAARADLERMIRRREEELARQSDPRHAGKSRGGRSGHAKEERRNGAHPHVDLARRFS